MFLDFYHLREQPFGVTPDPAYLYASRTHCEALDSLTEGILGGRGFLALIAEPGMGKTTLLYQVLEGLRETARAAFLFQTQWLCVAPKLLAHRRTSEFLPKGIQVLGNPGEGQVEGTRRKGRLPTRLSVHPRKRNASSDRERCLYSC